MNDMYRDQKYYTICLYTVISILVPTNQSNSIPKVLQWQQTTEVNLKTICNASFSKQFVITNAVTHSTKNQAKNM